MREHLTYISLEHMLHMLHITGALGPRFRRKDVTTSWQKLDLLGELQNHLGSNQKKKWSSLSQLPLGCRSRKSTVSKTVIEHKWKRTNHDNYEVIDCTVDADSPPFIVQNNHHHPALTYGCARRFLGSCGGFQICIPSGLRSMFLR